MHDHSSPYGDPRLAESTLGAPRAPAAVVALRLVGWVVLAGAVVTLLVTAWLVVTTMDEGGGANIGAGVLGTAAVFLALAGTGVLALAGVVSRRRRTRGRLHA